MTARRVSERETHLERENAMLRAQYLRLTANPPEIPFTACDNSCIIARANGMATNGGCRCDERKLRYAAMYWRSVAAHRLATLEAMKEEHAEEVNLLAQQYYDAINGVK